MFCLILGAIYLLLGIVGFVAPALVAAIIQAHGDDVNLLAANIVHFFDGRPAVGVIRVRVQVAAQIGVSRGFSGREIRTKMKRSC